MPLKSEFRSNLISELDKKDKVSVISPRRLYSSGRLTNITNYNKKGREKVLKRSIAANIHGDYTINKKFDILSTMKLFTQFKIIKQIILNEDDCFMLENKGINIVISSKIYSNEDFSKIEEAG